MPQDLRAALAALVAKVGENEARNRVGLSRSTFARALAGLGVYPGSTAMIRAALGGKAWP